MLEEADIHSSLSLPGQEQLSESQQALEKLRNVQEAKALVKEPINFEFAKSEDHEEFDEICEVGRGEGAVGIELEWHVGKEEDRKIP